MSNYIGTAGKGILSEGAVGSDNLAQIVDPKGLCARGGHGIVECGVKAGVGIVEKPVEGASGGVMPDDLA